MEGRSSGTVKYKQTLLSLLLLSFFGLKSITIGLHLFTYVQIDVQFSYPQNETSFKFINIGSMTSELAGKILYYVTNWIIESRQRSCHASLIQSSKAYILLSIEKGGNWKEPIWPYMASSYNLSIVLVLQIHSWVKWTVWKSED